MQMAATPLLVFTGRVERRMNGVYRFSSADGTPFGSHATFEGPLQFDAASGIATGVLTSESGTTLIANFTCDAMVGDGFLFSADWQRCTLLVDAHTRVSISIAKARRIVKRRFGLQTTPPSEAPPSTRGRRASCPARLYQAGGAAATSSDPARSGDASGTPLDPACDVVEQQPDPLRYGGVSHSGAPGASHPSRRNSLTTPAILSRSLTA